MTKDFGAAVRNSKRECKSSYPVSEKVEEGKYNSRKPLGFLPLPGQFLRAVRG
jgi:hypothetical protein